MVNPIPALTACAGTSLLIGLLTGAAVQAEAFDIPKCQGFDWLTGCDNTISTFFAYVVLGTIPGAHIVVNSFMGVLGLSLRSTFVWAAARWVRGGG